MADPSNYLRTVARARRETQAHRNGALGKAADLLERLERELERDAPAPFSPSLGRMSKADSRGGGRPGLLLAPAAAAAAPGSSGHVFAQQLLAFKCVEAVDLDHGGGVLKRCYVSYRDRRSPFALGVKLTHAQGFDVFATPGEAVRAGCWLRLTPVAHVPPMLAPPISLPESAPRLMSLSLWPSKTTADRARDPGAGWLPPRRDRRAPGAGLRPGRPPRFHPRLPHDTARVRGGGHRGHAAGELRPPRSSPAIPFYSLTPMERCRPPPVTVVRLSTRSPSPD